MSMMTIDELLAGAGFTSCTRCGRVCIYNPDARHDDARPHRLAEVGVQGVCVDCRTTEFLKTGPLNEVIVMAGGPHVLLNPGIIETFAELMAVGNSDAKPEELNWERIVHNWELPFPKPKRARRQKAK